MANPRLVKQGEHLSSIAAEEGFADFHTVFDHGDNAALKKRRNAHVLFPGDEVFIAEREDRTEQRPTDATHLFVAEIPALFLRCKLLDWHREPIKDAPCAVKVDGTGNSSVVTDGKGIFEQRIGRLAKVADIEATLPPPKVAPEGEQPVPGEARFHVKIGHLDPLKKMSGQQGRLNNLGYLAGYDLEDLDQLLWAAEEFLCDDSKARVTQRPAIVSPPRNGDGDLAENDPTTETGLTDAPLLKRLETTHGI